MNCIAAGQDVSDLYFVIDHCLLYTVTITKDEVWPCDHSIHSSHTGFKSMPLRYVLSIRGERRI